jgi:hypothetical protein
MSPGDPLCEVHFCDEEGFFHQRRLDGFGSLAWPQIVINMNTVEGIKLLLTVVSDTKTCRSMKEQILDHGSLPMHVLRQGNARVLISNVFFSPRPQNYQSLDTK